MSRAKSTPARVICDGNSTTVKPNTNDKRMVVISLRWQAGARQVGPGASPRACPFILARRHGGSSPAFSFRANLTGGQDVLLCVVPGNNRSTDRLEYL